MRLEGREMDEILTVELEGRNLIGYCLGGVRRRFPDCPSHLREDTLNFFGTGFDILVDCLERSLHVWLSLVVGVGLRENLSLGDFNGLSADPDFSVV